MSRRKAIWLSFVVLALHNVEEYLTIGGFLDAYRDRLPAFLRSMNEERFAVSLVIVTLFALLVCWAAARGRPKGGWLTLATAAQVGLGFNGIQHAAIAAWVRGYAPGVVTGVTLCLPYAVYLIRRAVREEWVGLWPLCLTALVLLVLEAPALMAMHALSMLIL
jgi:hypothetical protein